MTRDRAGLALLALFLGLVLVGGASAGSGAQASPWATLSHAGHEAQYLSSIGVNPKGFVVQRGHRNYAGPKCPGRGWTCTKSHRVLQLATAGGVNSVACTSSGGGGSVSSSSTSSAQTCTIVQVSTSGGNNATCTEQASTTSAGTLAQTCSIQQQSGSGKNSATVSQTGVQGPGSCSPPSGTSDLQSEGGTQTATVIQWSSAGGGTANVNQTASQCAGTTTTGAAAQSQATSQTFTIQQGPPNFDPTHPVCTNTGSLGATASQSQHQRGYATTAASGTQGQHADLIGHIDQCSNSHADYTANQSEDQFLAKNPAVTQTQVGPTSISGTRPVVRAKRALLKGACCSFQGTNGSDTCTITQNTSQVGNPTATQTEQLTTTVGTSGSCTGNISGTQNATPFGSTQSGSSVNNTVNCQSQVCTGALIPTTLTWAGGTSGTYHDPANLQATLTRADNNAPISGQTVSLGVGAESCNAVTDASGIAACLPQPVLNDTPGPYQASATFTATATYAGSSTGPVGFTVTKAPTTLTYSGDIAGIYHDSATLSGTLTETHTGAAISGRTVTFAVTPDGQSNQSCSTTTDSSGFASCTVTLTNDPTPGTVTASFAEDAFYLASGASTAFTINKAPTTVAYTGDTSGDYHDSAALKVHLEEHDNPGTAIQGRSVTLSIGSQSCLAGPTDASGNASCGIVLAQVPGTYAITASFDGSSDTDYTSSTDATQSFTINKAPTALTYTGDLNQDWNDTTTLSATLVEAHHTGTAISGEAVTFTVSNGTSWQTCQGGPTDANGVASCSFVLTLAPGPYTVTASFDGTTDTYYTSSTVATAYTVNREESVVVYTGATTGDYSDHVTLKGVLTADTVGGTPLSGRQLTFTLGSKSCNATTNSSGVASCSLMIGDVAGSYQVVASFGGDTYYASTNGSANFTITPEEDSLSYTGPTSGKKGSQVTLSAYLSSDDGAIAGRSITFTIGTQSCVGTTNSSGVASCSLTLTQNAGSNYTVNAKFAGDGNFEPASSSRSFTIKS
jgi:Bacterial Ig-like domain (group 3)